MKRFVSLLVVSLMLRSLCACGEAVSDVTTVPRTSGTTNKTTVTNTTTTEVTVPVTVITPDGFAYAVEGDGVVVTEYVGNETSVEIPQTIAGKQVVEIGFGAFRDSTVRSVKIPFGVKTIGAYAFYKSALENIEISETVTLIGNNAFSYTNLTEFESPMGISVIGFEVFSFCDSLQSVILGSNIDEIQEGAFAYCQSLEAVYVPNSVDYIAQDAFEGWVNGLVIYGNENSYIQQYAEDMGMEFEIV